MSSLCPTDSDREIFYVDCALGETRTSKVEWEIYDRVPRRGRETNVTIHKCETMTHGLVCEDHSARVHENEGDETTRYTNGGSRHRNTTGVKTQEREQDTRTGQGRIGLVKQRGRKRRRCTMSLIQTSNRNDLVLPEKYR